MTQILYVGLDVHKDSITIAVAPEGRDGAQLIGKFPNNITTLQRHFARWREGSTRNGKPLISDLGSGPVELKIAYEAGPGGFVLYRRLTQLGYDCQVAAPSLIPQSAGDRVKTDRRDAKKLAIHHRAGQLIAVYVPHEADEAIRDLCCARSDASSDLKRARQRLKAFMLRNGYAYEGKTSWNESHMNYLRELTMPCSSQKSIILLLPLRPLSPTTTAS